MPANKYEIADFAGGCFWNTEEAFRNMKGVIKTEVGYEGGHAKKPTYEMVCTQTTGHAETTRVTFDPKQISYKELVVHFFKTHDPTQLNRQGLDIGESYRSAVFYANNEQKKVAEAAIRELNENKYKGNIVTQILPSKDFYRAEDYHQQYLAKQHLN